MCGPGLASLVIVSSASVSSVMVSLSELFSGSNSGVVVADVAVFVSEPDASAAMSTVIVALAEPPAAMVPSEQSTPPNPSGIHASSDETNVNCGSNGSFTVTDCASDGPALNTVKV